MREQHVVLEYKSHPSLLGRNVAVGRRIVKHVAVELDVACDAHETGERSEKRGLAGAIGTKDRDGLAIEDRHIDAEREAVALDIDGGVEAQGSPSHRSRRPMRIASDTASRTRLRTIAPSGFDSNAI